MVTLQFILIETIRYTNTILISLTLVSNTVQTMADIKNKSAFHSNNRHKGHYNLDALVKSHPALERFIILNKKGEKSIKFSDPNAVKSLNTALLVHHYDLDYWDIPEGFLCPAVPGRADYVHHIADLLEGKTLAVKLLDIGTGANLVYPIVASHDYGWKVIGTDIDSFVLKSAQDIINKNKRLQLLVDLRKQTNKADIFHGIIDEKDYFDLTMCNPPFYQSAEDAIKNNERKNKNLHGTKSKKVKRNFAGKATELWTKGGEKQFLKDMVYQSQKYGQQVGWFTTLVSREAHIPAISKSIEAVKAKRAKIIEIGIGNKSSRIVAWRF